MNTTTTTTVDARQQASDTRLIVTAVKKLNEFFKDPENAAAYLDPNGWLKEDGMRKMQEHWTPHALCLTVMCVATEDLDKSPAAMQALNEQLHEIGAHATPCQHEKLSGCMSIEATHFYWIGCLKHQ